MKPHKQLFHEYAAMYRPYINQINNLLAPFRLYSSQWRIMHFILHHGSHTVSDLAINQRVEKPTTTKMVQRLIELDYLEVKPGEDRRTKMIELTKIGREVCDQVQEKIDGYQSKVLEDIPVEEQLLVARLLEKISRKLIDYKG